MFSSLYLQRCLPRLVGSGKGNTSNRKGCLCARVCLFECVCVHHLSYHDEKQNAPALRFLTESLGLEMFLFASVSSSLAKYVLVLLMLTEWVCVCTLVPRL